MKLFRYVADCDPKYALFHFRYKEVRLCSKILHYRKLVTITKFKALKVLTARNSVQTDPDYTSSQ